MMLTIRRWWHGLLCSLDIHDPSCTFTQRERWGLGGWIYRDIDYTACSRCGQILERRSPHW